MQCNMCEAKGGENEIHPNSENLTKHNGFLNEITFSGDYNSTHLMDLIDYKVYLCEACARSILNNCKIEPTMSRRKFGNEPISKVERSYQEDKNIMAISAWQHSKAFHDAYLSKKCNYSINCPNEAMYSFYLEALEAEEEEGFPAMDAEPTNRCYCEECLIKMKEDIAEYNRKSNNPKDQLGYSGIVKYIDPCLWNFK